MASLLWVSADRGCGKSVLAKYLADEVLPSTNMRTTYYFFFNEVFADQRSSVTALCSILHQIFDQFPVSFSAHILISKFYSSVTTRTLPTIFILTSRLYLDIKAGL